MNRLEQKTKRRMRRKAHIRKTVSGSAERPRMSVFKSARYIYVQAIDDRKGHTVAAACNREKELRKIKSSIAGAEELGQVMAKRLKAQKIDQVVFDRNGYSYHGIVKSIADGARKAGIRF